MKHHFSIITRFTALLIACLLSGCETDRTPPVTAPQSPGLPDPMDNTPFWSEGIEHPRFVSAEESTLPPETNIVGVQIESESFAFPLEKMKGIQDHVVNHVVEQGGRRIPLSVTYCDMSDCVRVLSSPDVSDSLKLATVGRSQGQLLLEYKGHRFLQNDQENEIPLNDVPFERTTLGKWLETHPGSKIYLGRPARE